MYASQVQCTVHLQIQVYVHVTRQNQRIKNNRAHSGDCLGVVCTVRVFNWTHCDGSRFEVNLIDRQTLVDELIISSARECRRLALLLFAHLLL